MGRSPRLALLYPGDRAAWDRSDPVESRFAALFEAFATAGVETDPAVYNDDFADEVGEQLRRVDGVLAWSNPIELGRRRDRLDALLREVAEAGVFVSTHPETILRLGTKDVLVDVRDLPFGSDAVRVDSLVQLADELPRRLQQGARVIKQYRGHSGIGVWRVEQIEGSPLLKVCHAQRGSNEEFIDLTALMQRLASHFEAENGGHMIDQAWQPRLVDGMVRAYLVEDRVAGFGHQAINALYPGKPGQPAPVAGPRLYHPADLPEFQPLKRLLEGGWIELLRQRVGLAREQLPMLWDCDFMLGEPKDSYVLCEINVSSVSPFPPSAIEVLVQAVKRRLAVRI
ncbi:Cj0069 family protein [Roseateles sp.]|uniref:Cj0069 family protein n=1 Tax=Roseateles sp. TaxID=1971397 RepID=UPI0025D22E6B|nr:Cj0069 family protein [Roseateles sp.]MBV8034131.1 Cj0069 family protein [Roseateles sp.]